MVTCKRPLRLLSYLLYNKRIALSSVSVIPCSAITKAALSVLMRPQQQLSRQKWVSFSIDIESVCSIVLLEGKTENNSLIQRFKSLIYRRIMRLECLMEGAREMPYPSDAE